MQRFEADLADSDVVYVVKDLVPDLTQFYKQYKSIEPYLKNDKPPAQGEFLQLPEDRRSLTDCTSVFFVGVALYVGLTRWKWKT